MRFEKTSRRKWSWTAHREAQAEKVLAVVDDLRDYRPLTLRQIYYRLVAAGEIDNTRSRYNDLSRLVKHMRLDDRLPWNALTDRSRNVSGKRGFEDHMEFIESELDYFMTGYSRCYVQGQEQYVEIWCEKDALSQVFESVAWPYCIRAVTCRGYQSMTFLHEFAFRARMAMASGQIPTVLYFGDLDPSGVQMLEATVQTLEDELELKDAQFHRIALNPEQVHRHNLPNDPDAVKATDKRHGGYVKRFGNIAVELDALHPRVLRAMAIDAIEAQFDMDLFREQQEQEQADKEKIERIRDEIKAEVRRRIGELV